MKFKKGDIVYLVFPLENGFSASAGGTGLQYKGVVIDKVSYAPYPYKIFWFKTGSCSWNKGKWLVKVK